MSAIQFLRRDIARTRFITTLEAAAGYSRHEDHEDLRPYYQLHQQQRVEGDLCGQSTRRQNTTFCKNRVVGNHYEHLQNVVRRLAADATTTTKTAPRTKFKEKHINQWLSTQKHRNWALNDWLNVHGAWEGNITTKKHESFKKSTIPTRAQIGGQKRRKRSLDDTFDTDKWTN
jgi:hypothetical protein